MHSLQASLLDLDLSVRLQAFLLCHVFLFLWTRIVVAPAEVGKERLVRCIPVVPVLLFLTFLFDVNRPAEFVPLLYCTHNFLWLTPTKLLAFCFNRGQLVCSYETGSNTAFALSLLCPVTIAFDVDPVEKRKGKDSKLHAYEDARFSLPSFSAKKVLNEALDTIFRMAAKVVLILAMNRGYQMFVETGHPFWRDVCSSWIFYGATAFIEDLTSIILLLTLNIKTATSFDRPWMAQSITELWSRRYNLVFGRTLRDLAYDPICEGSLIHGPKYFDKQRPTVARRLVAVLMTFGMSGLIHIIAMQHALKTDPMMLYGLFFVINGIIVVLENVLKTLVRATGYKPIVSSLVPSFLYHIYSISVTFTLAHRFFWPDLDAAGGAEMIAEGMISFFRNLKILP